MRIFQTTALISILATSAAADGLTYGRAALSHSQLNYGDADYLQTNFEGDVEYQIDSVLLSAELDAVRIAFDGNSYSYQVIGLDAGYMITPEALIGAGLLHYTSEYYDETEYQIFGQYQTNQFGLGLTIQRSNDYDYTQTLAYGEAQVVPSVTLGVALSRYTDYDETAYHFSADYDQGPAEARAFYEGYTGVDYGLFGLRGSYEIGDSFRVSAAYGQPTGDDAGDYFAYSIGGGYEIVEDLWLDAAYGSFGGDDAPNGFDRIKVEMTFEFGGQKRIDNRMEREIEEDYRALFDSVS